MSEKRKPTVCPPELESYVSSLLQATGSLMLIVDHLSRFELHGPQVPDADPIPETLTRLLNAVLVPLVERFGAVALAQAAVIVNDSIELACEEIFLASPREG